MSVSKKLGDDIRHIISNRASDPNQFIEILTERITADNPKKRTIASRFSYAKKQAYLLGIDASLRSLIKPDPSITESIIKENAAIRDSKPVRRAYAKDLRKIYNFRRSSELDEIAAFLILVSGRRFTELFKAQFSLGKTKYSVSVVGILKQKSDDKSCSFPCLIPASKFIDMVTLFKKEVQERNISPIYLQNKLNIKLKNVIKPHYSSHSLRSIYAAYSFKFRNPNNMKLNPFIRSVLCHESIDSSLSYTGWSVTFKKDIFS